ncbi:efflux RND transporter periplasmic adaptor subunit [Paenibacillus aurantius]|uniref:Efflux RND transporter periplasmic adaptor subunit n=1 Tax=Paenibacillus aurantius TaxID=2918900 RepID=A0AA96REP2_9BACL|nr:efflux RND transporter periplasmic adaptor subunit [Paenibacillus aurantius]WNQ12670.1 efflux RND transporter periplasmic adaptor subunit [Paenibacillus aurantius]
MRQKRRKPYRIQAGGRAAGILILSFAFLSGCSGTTPSAESVASAEQVTVKTVKVIKASRQKLGDPVQRPADAAASAEFEIISRAGGTISQLTKKRGDRAVQGEVIALLTSGDSEAQRDRAKLAVKTAQDAISRAKDNAKKQWEAQKLEMSNSVVKLEQTIAELTRTYNKTRNDYDVGAATKEQLYQLELRLLNTRTDLEQLKQKQQALAEPASSFSELETALVNAQLSYQQVEKGMEDYKVKAPLTGIISDLTTLEPGMPVPQGAKLGHLQKVDPIKIKAQLSEKDVKLIGTKTELTYTVPGQTESKKGKISFLSKIMDPETRTYELNLEVPNPDMSLNPGMKLAVQLTEEQEQIGLAVPSYAVVNEGDNHYLFVMAGEAVEKRKVELGRVSEDNQEIVAGLKEGDAVVVSNPGQLKDKEKVQAAAAE